MSTISIQIPAELLALLEATAIANECEPAEIIVAATEGILECDELLHRRATRD